MPSINVSLRFQFLHSNIFLVRIVMQITIIANNSDLFGADARLTLNHEPIGENRNSSSKLA